MKNADCWDFLLRCFILTYPVKFLQNILQVNKEGFENLPPEKRKKAFKEKIKEIEVTILVQDLGAAVTLYDSY